MRFICRVLLVLLGLLVCSDLMAQPLWQLTFRGVSANPTGGLSKFICTRGLASDFPLQHGQKVLNLNIQGTLTVISTKLSEPVNGIFLVKREMLSKFKQNGKLFTHIVYFRGIKASNSLIEKGFFYDMACYGRYHIRGVVTKKVWGS